ncbi:S4 domain-containing protein YaaA [Streptococcus sp. CSL10205-OR2]|uniref:S4 domain-containing protein YaaA n=1 Tax=Streptococcus sp. CSL10205-OR2 TaxID=2980558 RepID=UPI0021DB7791|nr:S4 domain-containing protein YaaA [Streptococcus sp. CSL10205-OR2]MCU9533843.1 S4 domain-containing protein YaaA [Streptococcus sp. CSL10205-OR2]
MDYKLFDDYITLQSLLKDQGIIQTGGAIKQFLAQHTVLLNGTEENRRGKKLFRGDIIEIPGINTSISISSPSDDEMNEYQKDLIEKERLAKKIKELNKENKKQKTAIRFPGT